MQKKSFLIKDILQKLNEDDSLKRNHQSTTSKLINNDINDVNDLEKNLKKIPTIDSNQLLYDWHSLAMTAMTTQNNNLINSSKNVFNWNKYHILNVQDKFNYLTDQKKLKNYFPFNTNLQSNLESINYQKTQLNYLLDEINENSNLSLCESSKFSDYDSNIDDKSETSSLISIEDTDDQKFNSDNKNDELSRKVKGLRKEEKKKRKNRRNRTVFTELQLMGLERRFDSQKYLSTPDRAELANALGLSQLQVKTWYQNRRMKWKKQVMQNGCLVAPTKPKGRPRKNSIPSASSLGITFETTSLLTAIESKNSSTILNKEINSKLNGNNKNSLSSNNLPVINMNSLINKDINCNLTTDQFNHLNEINQEIFNKVNFGNKKFKLAF